MKKSFENPAYSGGDFEGHAETPKELKEGKKAAGIKSQRESSAFALEHARKTGDKKLEASVKENIVKDYLGEKTESKELSKTLDFEQIKSWWKERGLDQYFDLEKQIDKQEKYWQKFHGPDFKFDLSKITRDAERLKVIETAVKIGCVNGIGSKKVSESLSEEERQMTKTEQTFCKILEKSGMDVWAKTGTDRWTKLELKELLKRYLPVECSDFNVEALQSDWVAEFKRVIGAKGAIPRQKPGEEDIFFTDIRQDIPADQKLVNLDGKVVENPYSFIGAISRNISFVTLEEEIIIAAQMHDKDGTYIAEKTWEWMMAIIDHSDKKTSPPVSAADANSSGDGFSLNSHNAGNSGVSIRLRVRL